VVIISGCGLEGREVESYRVATQPKIPQTPCSFHGEKLSFCSLTVVLKISKGMLAAQWVTPQILTGPGLDDRAGNYFGQRESRLFWLQMGLAYNSVQTIFK